MFYPNPYYRYLNFNIEPYQSRDSITSQGDNSATKFLATALSPKLEYAVFVNQRQGNNREENARNISLGILDKKKVWIAHLLDSRAQTLLIFGS